MSNSLTREKGLQHYWNLVFIKNSLLFLGLMSGTKSSRSVFVGNIPYDATEEQLIDIFKDSGPVVSFRLVFDKDTGKPKGYGFCEYRDSATAQSAMRNLNGYEMNGRPLRVDFAENEKETANLISGAPSSSSSGPSMSSAKFDNVQVSQSTIRADLQKLVDGMSLNESYELVSQLRINVAKNPDLYRHLLREYPQLGHGILMSMIKISMLTPEQAKFMSAPIPGSKPPPNVNTNQPMMNRQSVPVMAPVPTPMMNPLLMAGAPLLGQTAGFPFPGYQMPGMVAPVMQPPQPQPQPQSSYESLEVLPEEQRQLLEQVMKLTPEQIEQLSPGDQQQIKQLRQTMTMLNMGMGPTR
eukprot:TRINITY_DN916_c0_g1_i1.p1 TRINITY_DN916_c0_g1~~TRINITY_DN916_c0_g1_i1.p1  ORF type:complete len:353 (-),score=42.62 TRINITY_DN916_c0_g1_i1:97-1155(-)